MASTSQENGASTSDVPSIPKTEKSGFDQLPKEMHQMKIRDDRTDNDDDKNMEATGVNGNGTETGQIITTTIGGRNGQPKSVLRSPATHSNQQEHQTRVETIPSEFVRRTHIPLAQLV